VSRWSSAAAGAALALPSAAYGLAVRVRNAWFDRPRSVRRGLLPVVSIGNLAVGGTGKTPLARWLASHLQDAGEIPAIVSRGYGGHAGPGPLIVSTGSGPRVDARACGDEPFLLAKSLPGVIVVVGSDRVEGVGAAAGAGATVAVLDDGFQHRRLARDLDVVVLDGRAPFGNGRLLPAGPLREPPGSLDRAGVVVLTRLTRNDGGAAATRRVRAAGFSGPIVRAGHRRLGFRTQDGAASAPPSRAVAFCGIGDPDLFRRDLEAEGVTPVAFLAFRDHHRYDAASWERLAGRARASGVPLVTTEKDLVRLDARLHGRREGPTLLALAIETQVWDEAVLLRAVSDAVAGARGASR
jgi:tetraacyldisaccharide 4'-kinase